LRRLHRSVEAEADAVSGRMIIPVGVAFQDILLVSRTPTGIVQQRTIPVRFVRLVRPPR